MNVSGVKVFRRFSISVTVGLNTITQLPYEQNDTRMKNFRFFCEKKALEKKFLNLQSLILVFNDLWLKLTR